MSRLIKEIHDTAKGIYEAGAISKKTMQEFDALCLPEIKFYTPNQIKDLRLKNKVSQSVFAAYLNTTPSTIQKWEQGQKKPSRLALKLLSLVDRNGIDILAA